MTFGEHVRSALKERGLSQGWLARAMGVSVPFVNDLAHDRRSLPYGRIKQLASILSVDVAEVTRWAGFCPHCRGSGRV